MLQQSAGIQKSNQESTKEGLSLIYCDDRNKREKVQMLFYKKDDVLITVLVRKYTNGRPFLANSISTTNDTPLTPQALGLSRSGRSTLADLEDFSVCSHTHSWEKHSLLRHTVGQHWILDKLTSSDPSISINRTQHFFYFLNIFSFCVRFFFFPVCIQLCKCTCLYGELHRTYILMEQFLQWIQCGVAWRFSFGEFSDSLRLLANWSWMAFYAMDLQHRRANEVKLGREPM